MSVSLPIPRAPRDPRRVLDELHPLPASVALREGVYIPGRKIRLRTPEAGRAAAAVRQLGEDMERLAGCTGCTWETAGGGQADIELELTAQTDESYQLSITPAGVRFAGGERGLFYGVQTLAQILSSNVLPCCEITDGPHYAERSVMLDLGRAPYSPALLKRVVQVLARLKLNTLHLHLNDDHLCGVRFEELLLGAENPAALTMRELGELIEFARQYHVEIVPEFESWGHAGSAVFHYPALRGGAGRWEGCSFGIGAALYRFLREAYAELLAPFPSGLTFHAGMDEALWAVLPGEDAALHSPQTHLREIARILREEAANQRKEARLRVWLDHEPMEMPPDLLGQISVEPWAYNLSQAEEITRKVNYCSARGYRFMMGGGMSSLHLQGAYDATRQWCRDGAGAPGAQGVDMCIWETNDFSSALLGVYVGADSAWHPRAFPLPPNDPHGERERGRLTLKMRRWQNQFPEANPSQINEDRGPEVYRGKYVWREPGSPVYVAPTAALLDEESAEYQETIHSHA